MVKQITKSPSKIVHVEARKEGDMSRRQPDISRMKSVLGRPLVPLETGIRKILKEKVKHKAETLKC
jgi:UDP-glucose 4-epimerase